MTKRPSADRPSSDEITRAERRAQRREAERQRMPQHGKGLGVMVGNAIQRRGKKVGPDDGRPSARPFMAGWTLARRANKVLAPLLHHQEWVSARPFAAAPRG